MESNLSKKRRFRSKKSNETVTALVLFRKPLLPFQLIAGDLFLRASQTWKMRANVSIFITVRYDIKKTSHVHKSVVESKTLLASSEKERNFDSTTAFADANFPLGLIKNLRTDFAAICLNRFCHNYQSKGFGLFNLIIDTLEPL
jgi:hypothetical protein